LRVFGNIIGKERRLYEYHVSDVKAPTGAAMPDNGSDDIPYCSNTKTKNHATVRNDSNRVFTGTSSRARTLA
jgi:hypothetical protein